MIKEEAKGSERGRRGGAEAFTLFDDHYVHTLLFPPTHAHVTSVMRYSSVPQLALSGPEFPDLLQPLSIERDWFRLFDMYSIRFNYGLHEV